MADAKSDERSTPSAEVPQPQVEAPGNRWPQWRGPHRDGRVEWLPKSLPDIPLLQWISPLPSAGIGGLAADTGIVVVGGRDKEETSDLFLAIDPTTGETLWQVQYPAAGELDYGNSPRATPLIHGDRVYTLGAMGHLSAIDRKNGTLEWQHDLAKTYGTPELDWGIAGSPIIVGNLLIVQPGGVRGSIVAFDTMTGKEVWKSGNAPPGHSSMIAAPFGKETQVIGYDKTSLGGWNAKTGERLWTMTPRVKGDFNVPTPILYQGELILSTENNGTRLYAFDKAGLLDPQPQAEFEDLSPDTHTPVVQGKALYGVCNGLHGLEIEKTESGKKFQSTWIEELPEFYKYASLVASKDRLLCLTLDCQLLLIDPAANERIVDRWQLVSDRTETLSHPAFLGRHIFVRLGQELHCYSLEELP
ncbi:MAG: PQQ-binding-like beta-propeller repeat protein [Planctomycetaceae bacterium]